MTKKKLPERTCMACNRKATKNELVRLVRTQDNAVLYDSTGKINGRGAYICNNILCLDKVIKTKKLERSLDVKIDSKVYESLREAILDE